MGLCASQARLLVLTQRKSDLEFRRMQIGNTKLALLREKEEITIKYNNAMNNMQYSKTSDADSKGINAGTVRTLSVQNGKTPSWHINFDILESLDFDDAFTLFTNSEDHNCFEDTKTGYKYDLQFDSGSYAQEHMDKMLNLLTPEQLELAFVSGAIELRTDINDPESIVDPEMQDGISKTYYKEDDARAQAEYDLAMTQLKTKEEKLDMESTQLESEYTAVTTEMESVQNLVKKNTEKTFKYFS